MFMHNRTAVDVAYDVRAAVAEHSCGDTETRTVPDTDYTSFTVIDGDHTFLVQVTKLK